MHFNIVLVSPIYQHASAIGDICPLPPEISSPSHPITPPLGCHRAPGLSLLCHTTNSHWLSILHMVRHMFQCYFLNLSYHLLHPLCSQVFSLWLCLHCCPENRFISTIFLIPNTSINIQYLLYDLLCIIGSRFIHFIRIDSNAVYG